MSAAWTPDAGAPARAAAPAVAFYDELRGYDGYDGLRGYDGHREPGGNDEPRANHQPGDPADLALPLRIRYAGRELSLVTMVATFGTPYDITVAELMIESFPPADSATLAYDSTPA